MFVYMPGIYHSYSAALYSGHQTFDCFERKYDFINWFEPCPSNFRHCVLCGRRRNTGISRAGSSTVTQINYSHEAEIVSGLIESWTIPWRKTKNIYVHTWFIYIQQIEQNSGLLYTSKCLAPLRQLKGACLFLVSRAWNNNYM